MVALKGQTVTEIYNTMGDLQGQTTTMKNHVGERDESDYYHGLTVLIQSSII